jgi:deazaflavin-dependent oxidoreductase (nitroreductase family)
MAVSLAPNGTRGAEMPKIPRPLIKAMMGLSDFAYRHFGSRMRVADRPILRITTIGAKSGVERTGLVCWFPDADRGPESRLVVGSNGGAARHPAWCYNLAKDPDLAKVDLDGVERPVHAESLEGTERDEAWQRIVELSPRFGKYQEGTDRVLPVIRLSDAPASPS